MDDSPTGESKPQASEMTLGKDGMQIILLPRIDNLERTKKGKKPQSWLINAFS